MPFPLADLFSQEITSMVEKRAANTFYNEYGMNSYAQKLTIQASSVWPEHTWSSVSEEDGYISCCSPVRKYFKRSHTVGEKYTHKITFLNHHQACKHLSHQKFKLGEHPGLWFKAKGKYENMKDRSFVSMRFSHTDCSYSSQTYLMTCLLYFLR